MPYPLSYGGGDDVRAGARVLLTLRSFVPSASVPLACPMIV